MPEHFKENWMEKEKEALESFFGIFKVLVPSRSKKKGFRAGLEYLQERSAGSHWTEKNNVEKNESPWPVYDSGLYDAKKEGLNSAFAKVLDGHASISKYLQAQYPEKELTVGDFGGSGTTLMRQLGRLVPIKKSAGVVVKTDWRDTYDQEDDARRRHDVVGANLFLRKFSSESKQEDGSTEVEEFPGFSKLKEWVAENGKFDLIMERMAGPIISFDDNFSKGGKSRQPILLKSVLRWYETLAAGGTMLLQLPYGVEASVHKMVDMINAAHEKPVPELETDETDKEYKHATYVRLRRLEGSPDSLRQFFKSKKASKKGD